ncbi:MAG: M48 family metallopeptidase [Chitinophagaceae bacterium]|nr:MAG: M48 family metallopeptidase [Chitinophagaceae bacterium]
MKTWFGHFTSEAHAESVEATVLIYDKIIAIGYRDADASNQTLHWDIKDVEANFDVPSQSTQIRKRNEPAKRLHIEGRAALQYLQELQAEQNKPWHKKDKTKDKVKYLLGFLGVIGFFVGLYFLLVPWLAEKMAATVSVSTEEKMGNAVFDAMRLSSEEDRPASAIINEFFQAMKVPTEYNIHITVVKSDVVNAFALPGGNIVVYSGLLQQIKTYPELAALLSHEFTHVNNRHSTRSIFRQLGSRIFLSLIFGRFSSVTSVMIDQADRFKSLTYSRALEKEADLDGLAILRERDIDPEGFAELFQHLKGAAPASSSPEFLNSHPDIDKRVAYIRQASRNSKVSNNETLQAIFEKLNDK